MSSHIILIGSKHVGKSTVGQLLANKLNHPFVDVDACIESLFKQRYGVQHSCREIAQTRGMAFFRALETEALKICLEKPESVIALGGGAPMSSENQALIQQHHLILLTADADVAFDRVMQGGRPAFFPPDVDPRITFDQLWAEQHAVYCRLTSKVVHNNGGPDAAVERICQMLCAVDSGKSI